MSNVLEFEARGTVERQAREWLIRLDADEPLAPLEREALHEWLARSPLHREELSRLAEFWRQANVLTELAVPLTGYEGGRTAARRRLRGLVTLAASILAVVILAWWWMQQLSGASNGVHGTTIGEQKLIALSDGSSIRLNTDSQVQVSYTDRSRTIHLLRGEALFSVTRDVRRAFEVHAANGIVRAVGTAFAVRLDGGSVNVMVTEGIVDLADSATGDVSKMASVGPAAASRPIGRVEAGQTTTFSLQTQRIDVQALTEPELQRRLAWRDGYLAFSGEPLSEVVEQVNRYSPVTLTIADSQLASIAVGGRFRVGDLEAVLDVLHEEFGIEATRVDERAIVLSAAASR